MTSQSSSGFSESSDARRTLKKLKRDVGKIQVMHLLTHALEAFAVWCLLAISLRARFGWGAVELITLASFILFLFRDFPFQRDALARLEKMRPDSDYRFTTLMEFGRKSSWPDSPQWRQLVHQTRELLNRPTPFLSFPGFAFAFRVSAAVTCASLVWALVFSPSIPGGMAMPNMLRIKMPSAPVLAGSDVSLRVFSEGRMSLHRLRVKRAEAPEDEPPAYIPLEWSAGGIYEGRIREVRTDLKLTAVADLPGGGQIMSPEGRIRVVHPPTLAFVSAVITPPAYTKLQPDPIKTTGRKLSVYPGTSIDLRLESDIPVASVLTRILSGGRPALKTKWRSQEVQVEGKFLMPVRFEVQAVSADSLPGEALTYEIDTLTDRAPSVAWLIPTKSEMEAPVEGLVPLRWLVEDDFGLSAFDLLISTPSGDLKKQISVPFLPQSRQEVSYLLEVSPYLSYAGSEIEVRARAVDNDSVNGPKESRSEALHIRSPTVMDVYKRLTEQGSEVSRVMERLSGESTKLLKKMTAAARTMKAEGKIAWQTEQELVSMAAATEKAKREAEQALAELGKKTQSAAGQKLLDRQTLQKLSAIGSMMSQLLKDDYVRAQRELERAIGSVRIEEKERSMMSAKFNLEQFVDQVDRSYRMLSRVTELMEQSEALKAMQDLVQRTQEALSDKNAERLKSLGQDAASLLSKLQNLAKTPAFSELKKTLASTGADLQKQFEKAAQSLTKATAQESAENAEKLKKSLSELQTALQKGAEKSESAEKQNAAEKLESLIDGILFCMGRMQASHEYFLSARGNRESFEYSRHLRRSTALEPILQKSIAEISLVAERLIIFDPRPIQFLRRAAAALQSLAERDEDPGVLAVQLKIAYRSCALAAIQLFDSSQKLQKESGGKEGGMPVQDLAELLQQLISAQSMLNSRTQTSMQMNMFGDNLEQLAFQQELIRRSMEAESGRFSDLQEKLGRVDQLLQEMRKTEDDLRRLGPTQDVQAQQQKILNKLMELQQSLTEREEKEEKFEAEPFFGKPADTSTLRIERPRIDEKQFLRSLPPEYREAGKKYLRMILGVEPP